MSLVYNGQTIATNNQQVTITSEEYDKLSPEVKNDPNISFYVIDGAEANFEKLMDIMATVGDGSQLSNLPTGTVIGAIKELYDRLDGILFSIDESYSYLIANKSNENPNNDIKILDSSATDAERVEYLKEILGNKEDLNSLGYDTVIGALLTLYKSLDGLAFKFIMGDDPEGDRVSIITETISDTELLSDGE